MASRPRAVRPKWLAQMATSLQHRGPDDHGFLQWSGAGEPVVGREAAEQACQVGLAHLRLSILDLSEAGWQPMRSHDGRYHIVFNGEIYNYVELRSELERVGHTFRSSGDTEVLLAAFSQWGLSALPRLDGMFAFAVLDTASRTVTLARDPFGIKPLYYATPPGMFAFASEIKALLELPGVGRSAAVDQLHGYLLSGVMGATEATFFADIRQLLPGHAATIALDRPDRVEPEPFWAPPTERDSAMSFTEAAEQLRSLFVDSVRRHLRSDVPIGTALSGGIDSSAIVAAVRSVGGSDVDIRTFSFIADDPLLSEETWVDLQANAAGALATKVRPPAAELARDLDRLIAVQDEPFGSTSIYAQYRVFALAADAGIKVMLDGQGADEMLAGYPLYVPARIASLLRRGRATAALRLALRAGVLPGADSAARIFGKGVAPLLHPALQAAAARRLGVDNRADRWIEARWFAERGHRPYRTATSRSLTDALLRDLRAESLPTLLRYEDRSSMAFSIESRVPFLTPRIAEFVFQLPESYLVAPDATSKSVFRAAMRGLVPDAILDRRDKVGFATPEREWLQALRPWLHDVVGSVDPSAVPYLRLPAVKEELDRVLGGGGSFGWHVWRCINLIRWTQLYDVDIAGSGH